jgi:large subunit ribosomal protein L20
VLHSRRDAYIGRKQKKRQFRALWIVRLSAALMPTGLSYSRFIHGLTKAKISLNRKQLSEMAQHDTASFAAVVNAARQALAQ